MCVCVWGGGGGGGGRKKEEKGQETGKGEVERRKREGRGEKLLSDLKVSI